MGSLPDKSMTILRIYKTAELNIGETAWAKDKERQARRNPNVCFRKGEYKCNLFVYECILAAGFDIGCPNLLNPIKNFDYLLLHKFERPPTTHDWYDKKVKHFKFIGEGEKGLRLLKNGDILTDNVHMAIAFYDESKQEWTTIGAGEKTINKTKWGIEDTSTGNVRIFRYSPEN